MTVPLDRASCRKLIAELPVPAIVAEIFDGNITDVLLKSTCQDPYYSFVPGSGLPTSFCPLWECSTVVTGFDPADGFFKQFNLEFPERPIVYGSAFQPVVADLLISLIEYETQDVELHRIAEVFGYPCLDELLAAMLDVPTDFRTYQAWRSVTRDIGLET